MYKCVPLNEMSGLCKYCVGNCVRLENLDFNGTHRCTGFEPNLKDYPNWRKDYENSLKNVLDMKG